MEYKKEEKMKEDKNLILDANDRPSFGKWLALSFQHVFAMFSATVLVPLLTGLPISTALFASGIGTLIYILCTKARVPIYLGSSFAYISYIQTATLTSGGNYGSALTGLVIVGLVYVVVAIIIRIVGVNWLNKLLPPVVIGPTIIVIGLGLAANAVKNAGFYFTPTPCEICGETPEVLYDWRMVVVAIITMFSIAFISIKSIQSKEDGLFFPSHS